MNCQRVGLIRTVRYLMERFRRVLARHRRLRHAITPFMINFFSRKLQIKDSARPLARTRIEWGALVGYATGARLNLIQEVVSIP